MKNSSNIVWFILQIITIPMWLLGVISLNIPTNQANSNAFLGMLSIIGVIAFIYLFTANVIVSILSLILAKKEAVYHKTVKIMAIANIVLALAGVVFVAVLFVGVVEGIFAV